MGHRHKFSNCLYKRIFPILDIFLQRCPSSFLNCKFWLSGTLKHVNFHSSLSAALHLAPTWTSPQGVVLPGGKIFKGLFQTCYPLCCCKYLSKNLYCTSQNHTVHSILCILLYGKNKKQLDYVKKWKKSFHKASVWHCVGHPQHTQRQRIHSPIFLSNS